MSNNLNNRAMKSINPPDPDQLGVGVMLLSLTLLLLYVLLFVV